MAGLTVAAMLAAATWLPGGFASASTTTRSPADRSELCAALGRIRELDARAVEAIKIAPGWKAVRQVTIEMLVKFDRLFATAADAAHGRVRSDIEIQARYVSRVRSILEQSVSRQDFRSGMRDLEDAEVTPATDRLDRYSLRVCGIVRSPS